MRKLAVLLQHEAAKRLGVDRTMLMKRTVLKNVEQNFFIKEML